MSHWGVEQQGWPIKRILAPIISHIKVELEYILCCLHIHDLFNLLLGYFKGLLTFFGFHVAGLEIVHEGIDLAALFFNLVAVELIFEKSVGFFVFGEEIFGHWSQMCFCFQQWLWLHYNILIDNLYNTSNIKSFNPIFNALDLFHIFFLHFLPRWLSSLKCLPSTGRNCPRLFDSAVWGHETMGKNSFIMKCIDSGSWCNPIGNVKFKIAGYKKSLLCKLSRFDERLMPACLYIIRRKLFVFLDLINFHDGSFRIVIVRILFWVSVERCTGYFIWLGIMCFWVGVSWWIAFVNFLLGETHQDL